MNFKKLTALILLLAFCIPFLASCQKEPTPAEVWSSAASNLANSESLSLSFDIIFGDYKVKVDYAGNRTSGVKSYNIMFDDNNYPIYTDGLKTYYSADDLKFSVKSSEDSDIIREFMDFQLTNAARMSLTDDKLIDPALEITESSKKITFKVSGNDFASMFAPDEDITFTDVVISANLDLDDNFKSITATTTASGKEFYGIPLFDAEKTDKTLVIKVENIDFTGSKAPNAPEDTSSYPELVALAKTYPTGLFQSMKDSSKVKVNVDMNVDLVLAKMNCTVVINTTTQQIEGKTLTRTVTETTVDALGQKNTTKEDAFTNGNDDYTYYTDPENGNHKIKNNEDSSQTTDDILSMFTNADNLEEIFAKTEAAGSTITVDISGETLKKLMSETSTSDIDLGVDVELDSLKFSDTTLIIKLKKGLIDTVSMDMVLETSGDLMGTGTTQTIKINVALNAQYETLMNNYTVDIPTGYESYEDWT